MSNRLYEQGLIERIYDANDRRIIKIRILKENVDLDYAYKTIDADSEMVFFKADADQDRPNQIHTN